MKKLMILGASYSQIPLMKAAKRLGCETIAVTIPGNYMGIEVADKVIYADITDPEAVLAAAQAEKIDGITTCCMDLGILAQGYVCEKMHLPGPGLFGAKASCNKAMEKEAYSKCGVSTAKHFVIHNEEELLSALGQLTYPVILKAVDLMGSRGISRADSEEEAKVAFARSMAATSLDYVIVEKFIEGVMFGVEAMISGGKPAYILPLGNTMRNGNPTFPIGHYVPWDYADRLYDKIYAVVEGAAKALGFDHCAMDMDCMYLDDEVYVIESTARAGATCITDTVGIYYGIDYFEAIVKTALGEDVSDMFRLENGGTANMTRLLSADKSGIVEKICIPGELPDTVMDLSFNIKPGDEVRPMENGRDRIGQLIVKGNTLQECRETMDHILAQIRLEYRS